MFEFIALLIAYIPPLFLWDRQKPKEGLKTGHPSHELLVWVYDKDRQYLGMGHYSQHLLCWVMGRDPGRPVCYWQERS